MGGHFRYFGWYSDTGHTELITRQMANELRHWHSVTRKPMVMTEYGADTVAGLHQVGRQIIRNLEIKGEQSYADK